ncbi:MAG: serine/threonine protein kinase [Proteobacteria bacterium]|nr:serine/threonine protein kinase [Pseudomonadota bacterium]
MAEISWGSGPTQYFFELTPDKVMDALEQNPIGGHQERCTGYCQPLASFENRVYEVEFEDRIRKVVKFYRPGRWTEAQIREEHDFMLEILAAEIPVVTPDFFEKEGDTLRQTDSGLFYCVYPKVGGRQPEDLPPEKLEQLGRLIARMHGVGRSREARARIRLTPETYGQAPLDFLLQGGFVNPQVESRFAQVVEAVLSCARGAFQGQPLQRIHGDCHAGNILWNEKTGPFFIDFDDMVVGPPVQDLWLLAPDPGSLVHLVEGYHQMNDLPRGSLALVEILRALRMIHYATWIAKRYEDPAFQRAFSHFESPRYWDELTADLERQAERIEGHGQHPGF